MYYKTQSALFGLEPINPEEQKKTTVEKIVAIASKVAPLLQSIFSGKKAKELKAQAGQYDQANRELRAEISALDKTALDLTSQSNSIASQLKAKGINGFDGFDNYTGVNGFFDFLRPKKLAEKELNTAKATYEALTRDRDQKLTIVASMLDQLDALKKKLESSAGSPGIWLVALGLVTATVYLATQSTKEKV